MNRYTLLVLCLLLAFGLTAQDLVILHTNDVHSQMDPLESGPGAESGGVERRAAFITQMRQAYPNKLILLDAGDYNQGTPYFNLLEA